MSKEQQEKRAAAIWKARLDACHAIRGKRMELLKSVDAAMEGEEAKRAAALAGQSGETVDAAGNAQIVAHYPKTMAYERGLIPNVLARNSVSRVRPKDGEDSSKQFSLAATRLIQAVAEQNRQVVHMRRAVKFSLRCGLGPLLHGWDTRNLYPSVKSMHPKFLIWDPESDGTPGSARWMGREIVVPLDKARKEYDAPELAGDDARDDGDSKMLDYGDGYPFFSGDDDSAGNEETQGGRVTLAVVWLLGSERLDKEGADLEDVEAHKWALRGEGTEFSMAEPRKCIIHAKTGKLLATRGWGFVLDRDEFPVTLVRSDIDLGFWGKGQMSPLLAMQRSLTASLSFHLTRACRAAAAWYLIDPEAFIDPQKAREAIANGADLLMLELKPGYDHKRAIQKIELGELSALQMQAMEVVNMAFNDVTNYDGLFKSDSALSGTATGAEISEMRKKTAVAPIESEIDISAQSCDRKTLQIAMSRMNRDMVTTLIGKLAEPEGAWNERFKVKEIRSVDVMVEPGSSRAGADEIKASRVLEGQAKVSELVSVSGNLGIKFPPEKVAKALWGPVCEWSRLMGLEEYAAEIGELYKSAEEPPPPPPEPNIIVPPVAPMPMDPMAGGMPPEMAPPPPEMVEAPLSPDEAMLLEAAAMGGM